MNISIDTEFKNLIPPLTAEEYAGLEESILNEGCRDAIVLWGETIIDGHNRYEICTKHGVDFRTVHKYQKAKRWRWKGCVIALDGKTRKRLCLSVSIM